MVPHRKARKHTKQQLWKYTHSNSIVNCPEIQPLSNVVSTQNLRFPKERKHQPQQNQMLQEYLELAQGYTDIQCLRPNRESWTHHTQAHHPPAWREAARPGPGWLLFRPQAPFSSWSSSLSPSFCSTRKWRPGDLGVLIKVSWVISASDN